MQDAGCRGGSGGVSQSPGLGWGGGGDHLAECGTRPGQTEEQPYLLCIVCSVSENTPRTCFKCVACSQLGPGVGYFRSEGGGGWACPQSPHPPHWPRPPVGVLLHRPPPSLLPILPRPPPLSPPSTFPLRPPLLGLGLMFLCSGSPSLLKCHFPLQEKGSPLPNSAEFISVRLAQGAVF